MKVGDYVVPLSRQREWVNDFPTYPDNMENYVGQVGKIFPHEEAFPDKPSVLLVEFDEQEGDSWYYQEGWIRLATPEEARAYQFTQDVKRM